MGKFNTYLIQKVFFFGLSLPENQFKMNNKPNRVTVHDKLFEIYLTSERIQQSIIQMAEKINNDVKGKNPLFLVVLNGAFMFAADLLKHITTDCQISFVKLSSYVGTSTTSTVRELIGLDEVLRGRTVIIVEDIIDTGITMSETIAKLQKLEATEVKLASLLFKPGAFQKNFNIDYIGLEIPNDFIVGYGLDYNGHGRNLPDIYKLVSE